MKKNEQNEETANNRGFYLRLSVHGTVIMQVTGRRRPLAKGAAGGSILRREGS